MSVSEVAVLKKRIEDECEALRLAMNGPRVAASHDIIHHRYAALDQFTQRLAEEIGSDESHNFAFDVYSRVVV